MALTIKQLNGDASFLLTFEPIETSDVALSTQPFHVLLDPRIATASSSSSSVVAALQDLPDIDLVLVSSARSDHCHEATLRQLPSTSKTRILAEPAAARRIRGWRCFDKGTVEALPRWEDCPAPGKEERRVLRIPILPQVFGGEPGEVTLTYIGQKREAHAAIGITYRPPTVSPTAFRRGNRAAAATPNSSSPIPPCPPRLPTPALSFSDAGSSSSSSVPGSPASSTVGGSPMLPAMPPPPLTRTGTRNSSGGTRRRRSGRAVQSCATWRSLRTLSPHSLDRGVSVIFAPHGIPYRALQSYATTHLLRQAVLPLTALLHCFDAPAQPWYLGGSSGGMPMGQETASALGAKAWISCHDGERDVGRRGGGGVVGRLVGKKQRFVADEVQRALDASHAQGMASPGNLLRKSAGHHPTEVLALEAGEEIAMTSEGIWEEETLFADDKGGGGLLGLGLKMGEDEEGRIVTGAPALDWW